MMLQKRVQTMLEILKLNGEIFEPPPKKKKKPLEVENGFEGSSLSFSLKKSPKHPIAFSLRGFPLSLSILVFFLFLKLLSGFGPARFGLGRVWVKNVSS